MNLSPPPASTGFISQLLGHLAPPVTVLLNARQLLSGRIALRFCYS
jgi:hypothetical protein